MQYAAIGIVIRPVQYTRSGVDGNRSMITPRRLCSPTRSQQSPEPRVLNLFAGSAVDVRSLLQWWLRREQTREVQTVVPAVFASVSFHIKGTVHPNARTAVGGLQLIT